MHGTIYSDEEEVTYVCSECISDSYLSELIHSDGQDAQCYYCKKYAKSTSLEELASILHGIIQDQYYLTSSEPIGIEWTWAKEGLWDRAGELIIDVIIELIGDNKYIAEDIRSHLSDLYGHQAVMDGAEDPYAIDAQYAEQEPDGMYFRDTWEAFCQQVREHSRFFSQNAEDILNDIFGDLESLRTFNNNSVIRKIVPTGEDRFVFRSRVAASPKELEIILRYPSREIGAPPTRLARAGRMNAAGITVFYGAQDKNTCVSEVRPLVGSSVVVGKFEIIRPVRLLDLDALAEIYENGSRFEPGYMTRRNRAAFLRHLVSMISMPVMPEDETLEYLPTQVISEYLATCVNPQVDGILFHSSQTGAEGHNFVLFNHASFAEQDNIPQGTTFTFLMGSGPEDDYDPTITVFEKVPPQAPPKQDEDDFLGILSLSLDPLPLRGEDTTCRLVCEPTLRLVNGSVHVLEVKAVDYRWQERSVNRIRNSEPDANSSKE